MRHLRHNKGDKTTICGRGLAGRVKPLTVVHPSKARKTDCYWCRITYRSQGRRYS